LAECPIKLGKRRHDCKNLTQAETGDELDKALRMRHGKKADGKRKVIIQGKAWRKVRARKARVRRKPDTKSANYCTQKDCSFAIAGESKSIYYIAPKVQ